MTKKTALITGASGGLGADFALQLAKKGYHCILLARNEDKLKTIHTKIIEEGGSSEYYSVDLSNQLEYVGVISSLLKEHHIDVLINNAGFGAYGNFETVDIANQLNIIDLNCITLTYLTSVVGNHMITHKKQGYILNVASIAAFQPGPGMAVYFASKAFVLSFTQAVSFERKNKGIQLSTLCPGATKTEFFNRSKVASSSQMLQNMMNSDEVVRQGLEGLFKKKSVIIPGVMNKFLYYLTIFSPTSMIMKIVYNMMKK